MRHILFVLLCVFCFNASAVEVVDVSRDGRFDYAVAKASMKNPQQFSYGGLYLREPVQRDKEVVLFVHGANGSPRDWADVAQRLDSSKQQAWSVYYASGDAVSRSGAGLAKQVLQLMHENGLTRIRVVAHSMGGLVAWFIVHDLEEQVNVEQFITIATPWDGNGWARLGVYLSLHPADSWRDLVPESATLKQIWTTPLKTPYTLVYTIKNDDGHPTGDGVISIESQLAVPMETQAGTLVKMVASHVGVLHGSNAEHIAALVSGT